MAHAAYALWFADILAVATLITWQDIKLHWPRIRAILTRRNGA